MNAEKFVEGMYHGFQIIDINEPKGDFAKIILLVDEGKLEQIDVYNKLFSVDFSIDGFSIARSSAKLEKKFQKPDDTKENVDFDRYYVVKVLDGGVVRVLVPGDKVHIKTTD